MSASNGFATEAIGREATFIDRIMNLFGHIPGISYLAARIIHALGMDNDAADLVPKLSLLIVASTIGATPFIVKTALHLWFVLTRTSTTGSRANARWATFAEVFRGYTIPSRVSSFFFPYFTAFFVVVWFDFWFRIKASPYILIFFMISIGYLLQRLLGSYKSLRTYVQPYPLGKYLGINLYITGGRRSSLIRGAVRDQRQGHVMIVGPSSSGKTSKYFIPGLIEDASNNCSAIVIEAKHSEQEDMFRAIAPSWVAAGKKVMLYDPWNSNIGMGLSFNPLLRLTPSFSDPFTRDSIEAIVDAIYQTYETQHGAPSGDASYHQDQEKDLLKGLLMVSLFKPDNERNLAAVAEIAHGTLDNTISYIKSTPIGHTLNKSLANDISKNLGWFVNHDNLYTDSRAKMLRGIAGKLAIFTHPRLIPSVTTDELDLDIVFKEPTLLCIKAPLNVPGASTIASIIVRLLMTRVPNKLSYGGGENFKVFFYLDELPALSIPRFAEFCKTARSSGTGVIAAIQDRSDLADVINPKLGASSISGLLGNIKTQIYLPGLCHETAMYLSNSFGKRSIKSRRTARSTSNTIDFSYYTSREEVLLIQPDSIRNMPKNQCLVVDMNMRPFFAKTIPWYKSWRYSRIVSKNKNIDTKLYKNNCESIKYKSPTLPDYSNIIDPTLVRKHFDKKKKEISRELEIASNKDRGFVAPQSSGAVHDGLPQSTKDDNKGLKSELMMNPSNYEDLL